MIVFNRYDLIKLRIKKTIEMQYILNHDRLNRVIGNDSSTGQSPIKFIYQFSISLGFIVGHTAYLLIRQVPKGVFSEPTLSAHSLKKPSSPQDPPQEFLMTQ